MQNRQPAMRAAGRKALVMVAVMMRVGLAGFRTMMGGVRAVAGCAVRVMRRRLVIVFFVMTGRFAVMLCGFLVMVGGVIVMFACRMLVRHGAFSI